ncbi:MAG: Rqc2 family fibronectin-binding protein, partial [Planctomycetota bacterium]
EGGRIERIDQPEPEKLVLSVRSGPARYWLQISVHPRFSRLHLLTARPEEGRPAAGFCNAVRQHLTGAPIKSISQVAGDRVVIVQSEERDRLMRPHPVRLVAELVGVGSNLLLLNEEDAILAVLFREESARRSLVPGTHYEPLEAPGSVPPRALVNRFGDAIDPDAPLSLSRAIQSHYAELESAASLEQRREQLLGLLGRALRSGRRRLQKISAALARAEDAEAIRRRGELLKIALPRTQPGQSELVVEDLFEPERPEVTIELNPRLSPQENIDWLFGQYKKAKAGRERLAERARAAREEVEALEELHQHAEAAASGGELDRLRGRARRAGLLRPPRSAVTRPGARTGPSARFFRSAQGLEILVARNQRQNDWLTFTLARGNDYWLHVRGWPGPHVVVRKPPDGSVPPDALMDAAQLAVHFSKLRGTDYAEVAYTQCKNVRRLKGSKPGRVSYAREKTLRLRPDAGRLRRLLSSGGEAPGDEEV